MARLTGVATVRRFIAAFPTRYLSSPGPRPLLGRLEAGSRCFRLRSRASLGARGAIHATAPAFRACAGASPSRQHRGATGFLGAHRESRDVGCARPRRDNPGVSHLGAGVLTCEAALGRPWWHLERGFGGLRDQKRNRSPRPRDPTIPHRTSPDHRQIVLTGPCAHRVSRADAGVPHRTQPRRWFGAGVSL
jgi:hypothetical protein